MRLALAVLVMAVATIGSAAANVGVQRPTLAVIDRDPLVVRGRGFGSLERVVATAATLAGPRKLRVRANRRGIVVVRFRKLTVDACSGAFAVRLVGASGRKASKAIAVRGVCAQLDGM
jgi:hypothetical protein